MIETFKTLLDTIIGTYEPTTYTTSSGAIVIPNGLAGVDFSYVGSVLLLVVGIYSIFRLIGLLLKR